MLARDARFDMVINWQDNTFIVWYVPARFRDYITRRLCRSSDNGTSFT